MVEGYGGIYVTIVIDWYTKKVVGHHAGEQAKAWHWLKALNAGLNQQFPSRVRGHDLSLMSDNGCQATSIRFMPDCKALGIKQAFTSYNNPKGNADTERFMRTMKEELVWIREWRNPTEFYRALKEWIEYYNSSYLHSALGYQSPKQFETKQQNKNRQNTPLKYAC